MKIPFVKLHPDAKMPVYGSAGAAGADLSALCPPEGVTIRPGQRAMIPTGIAVQLPAGYVGLLCARSSLGVKHGLSLPNGVGVIDWDYRGQIQVALLNLSQTPYTIVPGERIAQLLVMPVCQAEFVQAESLEDTARGQGGFGSTGRGELPAAGPEQENG